MLSPFSFACLKVMNTGARKASSSVSIASSRMLPARYGVPRRLRGNPDVSATHGWCHSSVRVSIFRIISSVSRGAIVSIVLFMVVK